MRLFQIFPDSAKLHRLSQARMPVALMNSIIAGRKPALPGALTGHIVRTILRL